MKEQIAQNFSRAAQNYDAVTPVQQQSAETLFGLLRLAASPASPVLLDVGTGSGRLLALARRHLGVGWQLHGIDFAPRMLAEARRRFPQAQLYCCDAETYAYLSYDLIVSNFALQWCEQPARLLLRLYKALRPGGQLAVALPLRGSFSELAQLALQLSGQPLPLYPLPTMQDFQDIPGTVMKEQIFWAHYPSAYAAVSAIKQAGAHTTAGRLSLRALRSLHQHPGPFALDYRVLFIGAQHSALQEIGGEI